MIWSPEFWSRDAYRAKIKTPFELVVSAARATGSDVDTPLHWCSDWANRRAALSMPAADGYADKRSVVNTGALLNRLNYSLALAGNKMRGTRTDVASLLGMDSSADAKVALDRAVQFSSWARGVDYGRDPREATGNPQVLQAKLDDPQNKWISAWLRVGAGRAGISEKV